MAQDSEVTAPFRDNPIALGNMQAAKKDYYEKNKDKINLARRKKRLANVVKQEKRRDRIIEKIGIE
jgi:hypothetical protein